MKPPGMLFELGWLFFFVAACGIAWWLTDVMERREARHRRKVQR